MATLSAHTLTLFRLEMDWALFMALSAHPELAANAARNAIALAIHAKRPDLAYVANDLLCSFGGAL